MDLRDLIRRTPQPAPWTEDAKIPWDDPEFSARMLAEHLSQTHDAASRRSETIEAQVNWIHRVVLEGRSTRVLDLGCGPGLYTGALARLGHACVGIDFGPAAIEWARARAAADGIAREYILADVRTADYGHDFGLVMMVFGELNVFHPEDAAAILRKAHVALQAGGQLLLEVHPWNAVKVMGTKRPTWRASESGLFSPRPHLRLDEYFWDEAANVAITRHFVIDAETAGIRRYGQCVQAYTDEEYHTMLREAGFASIRSFPSLTGSTASDDLFVLLAERPNTDS